jgi:uncharacterized DUF497 family protein
MKVRFEWDPLKAAVNRRKHGVSFEIAIRVFADPFALTEPQGVEDGELRWRTLGVAEGVVVLLVAHTIRESDEEGTACEIVRIISARKADKKERARYEQENR